MNAEERFNAILARHADLAPLLSVAGPISRKDFLELRADARSFVVRGQAADWPAKSWSLESIGALGHEIDVEVTSGNAEQSNARLKSIRLADYIRLIQETEGFVQRGDDAGRGPTECVSEPPYLSLYPIFRDLPGLRRDMRFGSLYPRSTLQVTYGWVGPSGTVTGLHADHYENILAQIVGRKAVILFRAPARTQLRVNHKYDFGTTLSAIDLEHETVPLGGSWVVLEPADVLYLPRLEWHFVCALTASVSVSCFGVTPSSFLRHAVGALCLLALHQLGLHGRSGCVCHPGRSR